MLVILLDLYPSRAASLFPDSAECLRPARLLKGSGVVITATDLRPALSLLCCSVVPLLRESIGILMQRTPPTLDHALPECYQRVSAIIIHSCSR